MTLEMLSLRRCSQPLRRRLYSTKSTIPDPALAARTASTPLDVRHRRRTLDTRPSAFGTTDATVEGLTPTESRRYQRLRAIGKLPKVDGEYISEAQWIEKVNERRSRLRGFKKVTKEDGIEEIAVLGKRVYLPNIIFKLVRNNTPPGMPYNPYEATFRIPHSVTKTDIRSYLAAVYGVKTTYVRTDNYISPVYRRLGYERKPFKTYKRAVVGLVDPFYYPLRMEDMEPEDKAEREKFIEQNFHIQQSRFLQKYELLRMTKGQGAASWKFNAPFATKRSHILRLVAERKAKREELISGIAGEMKTLREKGEPIDYRSLTPSAKS